MDDFQIESIVSTGKALSDPTRIRILGALFGRECCACELVTMLGQAQASVSRHLSILVQSGLVRARKDGRWMHYRLPKKKEVSSPFVQDTLRSLRATLPDSVQVQTDSAKLKGCSLQTQK